MTMVGDVAEGVAGRSGGVARHGDAVMRVRMRMARVAGLRYRTFPFGACSPWFDGLSVVLFGGTGFWLGVNAGLTGVEGAEYLDTDLRCDGSWLFGPLSFELQLWRWPWLPIMGMTIHRFFRAPLKYARLARLSLITPLVLKWG